MDLGVNQTLLKREESLCGVNKIKMNNGASCVVMGMILMHAMLGDATQTPVAELADPNSQVRICNGYSMPFRINAFHSLSFVHPHAY